MASTEMTKESPAGIPMLLRQSVLSTVKPQGFGGRADGGPLPSGFSSCDCTSCLPYCPTYPAVQVTLPPRGTTNTTLLVTLPWAQSNGGLGQGRVVASSLAFSFGKLLRLYNPTEQT